MQIKALVAEFIGTFTLIFIGAGTGQISGSLVAAAFAFGLVVIAFAYAYGSYSGLHINPAVTIGLLAGGQIKLGDAIGYILVQLLGGIAGAATLFYVLGDSAGAMGATVPAAGVGVGQAFVLELFLTFLLVNAIYHAAVSGKAGDFRAHRDRFHANGLHLGGRPADRSLAEPGALARAGVVQRCPERDFLPVDLLRGLPAGRSVGGAGV